jgi:hypothetical protein
MKTCLLGEHKQGFGDIAYTKRKTWWEQKLVRALFMDKSFKTNINADSKQHEWNFVVFIHIEETSHPSQWKPAFLANINKALATIHTLSEKLGKNKN